MSDDKNTKGEHFRLICPIVVLAKELCSTLKNHGWVLHEDSDLILVVDGPWGIAIQALQGDDSREMVIVTDSPCPEYWEDLWSLKPRVLLAGGHSIAQVASALDRAHTGDSFRDVPYHGSTLTLMERKILRASATGLENRRIANQLNLTEGTVKNGVTRVLDKLQLENRTQIALYYWGLEKLLDKS